MLKYMMKCFNLFVVFSLFFNTSQANFHIRSIKINEKRKDICKYNPYCKDIEETQKKLKNDQIFFQSDFDKTSQQIEMDDVVLHREKCHEIRSKTANINKYNWPTDNNANDMNRRSISPWFFIPDVDKNRRPIKIYKACCLYNGCIDHSTGNEDLSFESVNVMYNKTVRINNRRRPKFKNYKVIQVPGFCVCKRKADA